MGPILCQLADLPNQYHSRLSFTMIIGITPAPSEPGGCLLPRLLLALVALGVDLLSGECDGLWIKTPGQLCCLGTMPAAFDAFFHLTISYQTIL